MGYGRYIVCIVLVLKNMNPKGIPGITKLQIHSGKKSIFCNKEEDQLEVGQIRGR